MVMARGTRLLGLAMTPGFARNRTRVNTLTKVLDRRRGCMPYTGIMADSIAARLRAREPAALDELRLALALTNHSLPQTAELLGLAGPSSLWRIAYAVPEVRSILRWAATERKRTDAHG